MLAGGDRPGLGSVHHHDASPGGGLHIDVVHTDPRPADQRQVVSKLQGPCGDPRGRSHHQGVERRECLAQGLLIHPRPDDHFAGGVQDLQAFGGELVGDQNLEAGQRAPLTERITPTVRRMTLRSNSGPMFLM